MLPLNKNIIHNLSIAFLAILICFSCPVKRELKLWMGVAVNEQADFAKNTSVPPCPVLGRLFIGEVFVTSIQKKKDYCLFPDFLCSTRQRFSTSANFSGYTGNAVLAQYALPLYIRFRKILI